MEPLPTEPNELGDLRSSEGPSLGSLAQSARSKRLRQARRILLVIGVITVLLGGGVMASVPFVVKTNLDQAVEVARRERKVVNQARLKDAEQEMLRRGYLAAGITVGMGVFFIALGLMVRRFPVPATLTALVVYVADAVIWTVINSAAVSLNIGWILGWIIKIIIIVALAKALQAAIAFQKEKNQKKLAALESDM